MATTPTKPPVKPAQHSHDEREDKRDAREDKRDDKRAVTRGEGEPADKPAPDAAPPVETIADEQRKRSDAIAAMGVEKWKAAHDERTEEEKAGNKQVPGVAPPAPEHASTEAGSLQGSTRTTQAARHAQNPAAPR
jgi:hypothetical protein